MNLHKYPPSSKNILQCQLECSWAMGVYWVKEATPCDAIRTRTGASGRIQWCGETGCVIGPTIATDNVAACVSKIRIIGPELGMVENVERFHAELGIAAFRYFEVLQKGQIKIY